VRSSSRSPVRHGISPGTRERWLVSDDMERVDAVSLLVSPTRRLGRDGSEFVGGDSQPIRTETPLIPADSRLSKTARSLVCGDRKPGKYLRFWRPRNSSRFNPLQAVVNVSDKTSVRLAKRSVTAAERSVADTGRSFGLATRPSPAALGQTALDQRRSALARAVFGEPADSLRCGPRVPSASAR
jgi:hypothetical protein